MFRLWHARYVALASVSAILVALLARLAVLLTAAATHAALTTAAAAPGLATSPADLGHVLAVGANGFAYLAAGLVGLLERPFVCGALCVGRIQ